MSSGAEDRPGLFVRARVGDSLLWGIKSSLRDYVAALSDGRVLLEGGAAGDLDNGFAFPVRRVDGTSVETAGSVTLCGYGMTLCEVTEPRLDIRGDRVALSIRRWAGRDARLEIGDLGPSEADPNHAVPSWSPLALAESGRELFDFRYEPGVPLDPVALGPSVLVPTPDIGQTPPQPTYVEE